LSLVQINLRLILVSGKTKEFLFSPNDSAADIAKHVYDNWPMDWEEEQVSSPNILRLIYQGRFLHGNVTLGALKLPLGKTTVMHLVARETLPEPNSQGNFITVAIKFMWTYDIYTFVVFFVSLCINCNTSTTVGLDL
ncbi:UBL3 protein, partial [Atractosteus spatula]|nr:UBL3 protein [Atractosteus spatula]